MPLNQYPRFDAASRQFIETELALCDTLLDSAARYRDHNRPDRANEIVATVERACEVISVRLADAEARGWNVASLQKRFDGLRQALDRLRRQSREAA